MTAASHGVQNLASHETIVVNLLHDIISNFQFSGQILRIQYRCNVT
jgi:hypothetical protein